MITTKTVFENVNSNEGHTTRIIAKMNGVLCYGLKVMVSCDNFETATETHSEKYTHGYSMQDNIEFVLSAIDL